jgi:beta-galactosidase
MRWLRGRFAVSVDGHEVQRGRIPRVHAAPGEAIDVQLPLRRLTLRRGQEALLTVRFETSRDLPWAEQGHEVAWQQLPLGQRAPSRKRDRASCECSLERGASTYIAEADGVRIEIDRSTGTLEQLSFDREGQRLLPLDAGPRLQVWRAPTDNDGVKAWGGGGRPLGRWLELGLDRVEVTATRVSGTRHRTGGVTITVAQETNVGIAQRIRYQLAHAGVVEVENLFRVPGELPDLPRLGVVFCLPPGYDRLQWLGRGPHESYADRRAGAAIGCFENTVANEYVPYIVPQEHGNHTDVRWLKLCDESGRGLAVEAVGDLLEYSASHFTAEDLSVATHTNELQPRSEVILNLDCFQRGLGTGACGPDTLPAYRSKPGSHFLTFRLRAVWP